MNSPRTKAWTAKLRVRLAKHGSQAELARFLTAQYGSTQKCWQPRIQRIIKNQLSPRAEIYLAIEEFLSKS
jgi:hypothetical protein